MKILPLVLASAAAAAAAAPLAASAVTVTTTEEIVFTYDLKSELLSNAAGVQAVYADLERSARSACTIPGVRGFDAVDTACAADLVEKVIVASGSAALDQYYASVTGAEGFDLASR